MEEYFAEVNRGVGRDRHRDHRTITALREFYRDVYAETGGCWCPAR